MKNKIVLVFIIALALVLRVYRLDKLPSILNRDEAALAYNGLLLSQSGKDEFGKSWPLTLESFGDYKLPGYPYTLALLFKFLPNNDLVVRLPSAIAGVALVALSYFLAGPLLAFLIAITPVFLFYSRMAFEANIALFFLVLFLYCWEHKKYLWSLLSIILSILFYNTALLLLPFIMGGLFFNKKQRHLPSILVLFIVFILSWWQLASVSKQKAGITIFSDETVWKQQVDYYESFDNKIWQKVLGNKYLFYAQIITKNYLCSFSPQFLLLKGGTHPWHNLPNSGHLYFVIYFLALLGIIVSIYRRKNLFWLYLLFISLLPAVITVDAPHATRSLLFFYCLSYSAVVGLKNLSPLIFPSPINRRGDLGVRLYLIFIFILTLESIFYLKKYFLDYPQQLPEVFYPGFAEIIQDTDQKFPDTKIAVIDPSSYQYILAAWYLQTPADKFLPSIKKQLPDKIGFKYGEAFTHYHFIFHPEDRSQDEKILLQWMGNHWERQEL